MNNNYKYVYEIDSIAGAVYKSREFDHLSFRAIGRVNNIPSSKARSLYLKAKKLIKVGDFTWMDGLSQKAQTQLLKTEYTNKDSLRNDVVNELIDLEDFPGIGHKVAMEIRRWCVKNT